MIANELRLGNYFQSNIIQQVQIEHLEFLLNDKLDHSVMQPIPLSEEWLIKLGFEQQSSPYSGIFINRNISIVSEFDYEKSTLENKVYKFYTILYIGPNSKVVKEFKYIHDVQNFIHALTGEELAIKE